MREIRFRVWNSVSKYMHDHGWLVAANVFYSALSDPAKYNHVMQYTGLKDKNGKEIWEGDIIQIEECECTGHDDNDDEIWESCEGEISFEDGMFVFSGHSAGTLPLTAYIERIEVIGNIHQNPELL